MRRLSLLLAMLMLAFAHGWPGPVDAVTAVLHFKGTNLMGDVELELNDADDVFTIDKSSLGQAAAEGGQDILVTYAPPACRLYCGNPCLPLPGC